MDFPRKVFGRVFELPLLRNAQKRHLKKKKKKKERHLSTPATPFNCTIQWPSARYTSLSSFFLRRPLIQLLDSRAALRRALRRSLPTGRQADPIGVVYSPREATRNPPPPPLPVPQVRLRHKSEWKPACLSHRNADQFCYFWARHCFLCTTFQCAFWQVVLQ
jgi:hypothetical protein